MTIDYEAQFKALSTDDFLTVTVSDPWLHIKIFDTAKAAFGYASRRELTGHGVAFGAFADRYYVWSE